MDAELAVLQQQLRSLQESTGAVRLSESNCVELVGKLVGRGRLELLYTLDGSQYVTLPQLEWEIADLAHTSGRVEVVRLQTLLNIDLEHISRQVQLLVARQASTFRLVQGELLTQHYLDSVCFEINDMLRSGGRLSLAALATRFQFSSDFVATLVSSALGSIIHGVLEDGILYTDLFVQRERARLRGALEAITVPTLVPQLLTALHMHKSIFQSLLRELLAEGTVRGQLSGHGTGSVTYVPDIFRNTSERFVRSFYSSNGFIAYDRVANALGIDQPQAWLKQHYPDGIALATCFLEPRLVEQLDVGIDESLNEDGWADLEMLQLPPSCGPDDCLALLDRCQSLVRRRQESRQVRVVDNRFLFGEEFFSRAVSLVENRVFPECITLYLRRRLAGQVTGGASKKPNVGKGPVAKLSLEQQCFREDQCRQALTAEHRNVDSDVLNAIARAVHGHLLEAFTQACIRQEAVEQQSALEKTSQSALPGGSDAPMSEHQLEAQVLSKDRMAQLMADFPIHFLNFNLFAEAVSDFPVQSERAVMERHLVRTTGLILLDSCLRLEAGAARIIAPVSLSEEKDRNLLVAQFSHQAGEIFRALLVAFNAGQVSPFKNALRPCMELCELRERSMDTKSQRQLLNAHRQGFLKQLEREDDPSLAFHLACVCIYAYHRDRILNIPSRCVPALVGVVVRHLGADKEAAKFFKSFADDVTQLLSLQPLSAGEVKKEEWTERLVGLKSLVVVTVEEAKYARKHNNKSTTKKRS